MYIRIKRKTFCEHEITDNSRLKRKYSVNTFFLMFIRMFKYYENKKIQIITVR